MCNQFQTVTTRPLFPHSATQTSEPCPAVATVAAPGSGSTRHSRDLLARRRPVVVVQPAAASPAIMQAARVLSSVYVEFFFVYFMFYRTLLNDSAGSLLTASHPSHRVVVSSRRRRDGDDELCWHFFRTSFRRKERLGPTPQAIYEQHVPLTVESRPAQTSCPSPASPGNMERPEMLSLSLSLGN